MSAREPGPPHAAAELVARESYGRLLAYLAVRWHDVAAAQDVLSDAFAAALESWPRTGVPAKPEAWLLTVARRKLIDEARGQAVRRRDDLHERLFDATISSAGLDERAVDDRLRLMLVCAHPAIDAAVRPALILQTVLGLEVRQMAGAFLLSPDTLNKRLVRAKAKIKASGMRFEEPEAEDVGPRLHDLLEAIYAAYFIGREDALVHGDAGDQLGDEAIYLADVVAALLPDNAEAIGFRALLLFCDARRPAQIDAAGEFVPLLEQDPRRWDAEQLGTAYQLLGRAAALRAGGPFQLEAAIQGAHCYRGRSGTVPWQEIASLYASLVAAQPTVGAMVGMAVAMVHAGEEPSRAAEILRAIDPSLVRGYQPYWVAMSHVLEKTGHAHEAATCLERALGLTTHPRLQRYLRRRLAAVRSGDV
ncbi:MAG: RNA polymerase subunit sigma-70 [Deltaproteobacteria bacterium]|nr:RNA polymerase subunit sigma-70 [Nannocystaceae bacterium]